MLPIIQVPENTLKCRTLSANKAEHCRTCVKGRQNGNIWDICKGPDFCSPIDKFVVFGVQTNDMQQDMQDAVKNNPGFIEITLDGYERTHHLSMYACVSVCACVFLPVCCTE